MANDILITPGSASIQYSGSEDANVELLVQPSGSLSWQGSGSGQLFNIENSFTGSLMAVTDISGIPILEVFSNNEVTANGLRSWRPYVTKSADFTVSLTESGYYFRCGDVSASISTNAEIPFALGTEMVFYQTSSAGNTNISCSHGVLINYPSAGGGTLALTAFMGATIKKVGTDEWDLLKHEL